MRRDMTLCRWLFLGIDKRAYTAYTILMDDVTGKYFELEKPFTDALALLTNPSIGVVRSQRDVVKAAIRSEWERVFPGVSFPGDETKEGLSDE